MPRSERERVERWFIRQGLPHLIHDYRAATDVFTRALPFLLIVFFFNVVGAFGDRFAGWSQAGIAVASTGVITAAALALNALRGRKLFQLPDRVGTVELVAFVIVPTLPSLLFGTAPLQAAAGVVLLNVCILVVVYVVVGYGLVPTTVWAIGQTVRHVSQLVTLMGRALPLVLVFSAFLFINAELWQVAHNFTPFAFWTTIGLLLGVAAIFIAVRIPNEISEIARFGSWTDVCMLADDAGSPLTPVAPESLSGRHDPPLSRTDRVNVALVVLFNLGLQIILVSAAVGAFYLLFGVLTIREETIVAWTALDALPSSDVVLRTSLFETELVLTVQLLRVVGFLAAFSAVQFAVSALTDATYRHEFFEEVTGEVRQALAVRAVYLCSLVEQAGEPVTAHDPGR